MPLTRPIAQSSQTQSNVSLVEPTMQCISVTVVISIAACYFVDVVKHDGNNVYGIMAEYGREGSRKGRRETEGGRK